MNCIKRDYFDNFIKIKNSKEKNTTRIGNNFDQINSNFFEKVQGIYILKKFEEAKFLPQFIKIEGKVCRKYLNIFYLHKTLSQLLTNQVLAICDIRLDYINDITSIEYNRLVISELLKRVIEDTNGKSEKQEILDFGIGSGISIDCLRSLNLEKKYILNGTDISKKSLKICAQKGVNTFHWNETNGKYQNKFDGIISSFVFDFNITLDEMKKLHSLLKKGGRLVLNLYKDDLLNFDYVAKNLVKAGFEIKHEEIDGPKVKLGIGHNTEKIFIAEKL